MKRRDFLTVLGGVAWVLPSTSRGQTLPLIGFVHTTAPEPIASQLDAFRKGLATRGYREGANLRIEYRWARGQYDALGPLVGELVRLKPALIAATGGSVAAKAAKSVTSSVPILFIAGFDPVQEGLVSSLGHPGGNATGVGVYTAELGQKRLEMLSELAPNRPIFMLVNPDASSTAKEIEDVQQGARQLQKDKKREIKLTVLRARTEREIADVLTDAAKEGPAALLVSADSFLTGQRVHIVTLATRFGLIACYPWPQYVEAGGLISYGTDLNWAFEQIGIYAARILGGARPNDLPVELPIKFSTSINMNTARAMQVVIPQTLQVAAERVIE